MEASQSNPWTPPVAAQRTESFDRKAALSGMQIAVAAPFHYGRVAAVLAGVTVDLRGAVLPPSGAILEVQAAFAGVEVLVPPDWNVFCDVEPVLGGVSGDRPLGRTFEGTPEPHLRITGNVAFGGLHVR